MQIFWEQSISPVLAKNKVIGQKSELKVSRLIWSVVAVRSLGS